MPIIKITNNKTYVADDLFQWDKDQVLMIFGLSLTSIPEIHFATPSMKEAIVKQATLSKSGVISVTIPNILLEGSAPINVYISGYEGSAFRTWYKMQLTVKARTKPADFISTEDDEEVYSFNALENKIDNTIRLITMSNEDLQKEIVASNEELHNKIVTDNKALHTQITEEVSQFCENNTKEFLHIIETTSIGSADKLNGYGSDDFVYSSKSGTTTFNSDGSITTTYTDGTSVKTVFNADGSITETRYANNKAFRCGTTVFNSDGSIKTTYENLGGE